MTDNKTPKFKYEESGLPANARWQQAAEICNDWLLQNMGRMFGPERIVNFMHNQPVAAAKRLFDNCQDWSEESITVLLLGPAKEILVRDPNAAAVFGQRAVDLLKTLIDTDNATDDAMLRDANRIILAEAVSAMTDQMIGRAKIDAHHETRWNMLHNFERQHAVIKGQDPSLDKIFEDAAQKSREALVALDKAAAAKKKPKAPGL